MGPLSRRARAFWLVVTASVLSGCSDPLAVETGPDDAILFLVERTPASSVMDALYRGRVEIDQAGCLRLAGEPDRHTVVWPFGSRLARDQASLVVTDVDGEEVLRLGELVELGGGEVPGEVITGLLSPELAGAALERCPGSFWIVGAFGS